MGMLKKVALRSGPWLFWEFIPKPLLLSFEEAHLLPKSSLLLNELTDVTE